MAYVTRPYVMYNDSKTDRSQNRFENLKKIWADRTCVFIEGKYTALGVGNDLIFRGRVYTENHWSGRKCFSRI